MAIGLEKGRDTETRIKHNFGMARPEGYRKARRLMHPAVASQPPWAFRQHEPQQQQQNGADTGRTDQPSPIREAAHVSQQRNCNRGTKQKPHRLQCDGRHHHPAAHALRHGLRHI